MYDKAICTTCTASNFDMSSRNSEGVFCSKEDLVPLESQVAGHGSLGSRSRSGIYLHVRDGYIVKPIEKTALFEKERKAYDFINSKKDEVNLKLQEFLPQYYGVRKLRLEGKDVNALALQDITHDLLMPCVMDVKIGRQTWEPDAPEEKIKVEKGKYVECRRDLGFCIPGIQYCLTVGTELQLIKHGKEYGKSLDKNGAILALKTFVSWDPHCRRILILQYLCRLQQIFQWFQCQDRYLFYSSSLLFVYDASEVKFLRSQCNRYMDAANNPVSYPAQILRALENCLSHYYSFKEEADPEKRMDYLKKASSCLENKLLKTMSDEHSKINMESALYIS
ncbi:hypothetical protein J437_LFUL001714 [Ladona fulva]|uniref:Kinase n=1 Tax=Ladona fulva TaxID=123851 RepID=A0A8K0NXU0_LADFU|nr:hypothetical protein J437_LFUL001714 [Ladona fulva]